MSNADIEAECCCRHKFMFAKRNIATEIGLVQWKPNELYCDLWLFCLVLIYSEYLDIFVSK